jgi:hypothetical protein
MQLVGGDATMLSAFFGAPRFCAPFLGALLGARSSVQRCSVNLGRQARPG